mmetsp:Transcript_977/g.2213  ORF Transcript_977/g.2213 Transcript_977/m.2213 type:complete len:213 (+) Transcript_977:1-639(+)
MASKAAAGKVGVGAPPAQALSGGVKRGSRREVLSQGLLLVQLAGNPLSSPARAVEATTEEPSSSSVTAIPSGSCSCPRTAPCPAESTALVSALPAPLVAWSSVTGECLPWGPGGPVGVIASAFLFRNAALGLGEGRRRTFKDAKDAKTRRSLEVEQGLRSLDAQAKTNAPFVGAAFILLLSTPRDALGLGLALAAAGLGIAAGVLQNNREAT